MHVRFDTYGLKLFPFILKVVAEETAHELLVEAVSEGGAVRSSSFLHFWCTRFH